MVDPSLQGMADTVFTALVNGEDAGTLETASRVDVAAMVSRAAENALGLTFNSLNPIERRNLIASVVNRVSMPARPGLEAVPDQAQPAASYGQKPGPSR